MPNDFPLSLPRRDDFPLTSSNNMAPHPNHPRGRCRRQFDRDETQLAGPSRRPSAATQWVQAKDRSSRNASRVRPRLSALCAWRSHGSWCFGCRRFMRQCIPNFRRHSCSPACLMRTSAAHIGPKTPRVDLAVRTSPRGWRSAERLFERAGECSLGIVPDSFSNLGEGGAGIAEPLSCDPHAPR